MDDRLKSQNPNVRLQGTTIEPQLEIPQGPDGSQPQFVNTEDYQDNPYMDDPEGDDPYMAVDTIPNTENLLQKAMKMSQGFTQGFADTSTLGGSAMMRGAADKMVPLPPEGEAKVNEIMATDPTSAVIGASIPIVKGITDIGKFGFNAMFPQQAAKKALPKASGKLTKSIQEVITKSKANPQNLGVPKDEVLNVLETEFAKSKVPTGEQATVFRKWITALKDPNKFGPMLTADEISEMETVFGKVSKFGKGANNPILQQGAKQVRKYASDRMDLIAKKAGVPSFVKNSAEKSKLLYASKAKPNFLQKAIKTAVTGGILGAGGKVGYDLIAN